MTRRLLRSEVAGRVPSTSEILEGQLFINLEDQTIYSKDSSGTVTLLGRVYPVASETQEGLVSTGTQTFSGDKTIKGDLRLED